jgi:hypothetical protein
MAAMIEALEWRECVRGTLRAFVTLVMTPPGLILKDCSVHEHGGKRWAALPIKPLLDSEGRQRRNPETGQKIYASVCQIKTRSEREKFQVEALDAIDRLLGKGGTP